MLLGCQMLENFLYEAGIWLISSIKLCNERKEVGCVWFEVIKKYFLSKLSEKVQSI